MKRERMRAYSAWEGVGGRGRGVDLNVELRFVDEDMGDSGRGRRQPVDHTSAACQSEGNSRLTSTQMDGHQSIRQKTLTRSQHTTPARVA